MIYDFHVHDAIRVEYLVSTDGPSFPRGYSKIQSETRVAGGNGVVAAVALARWGAKVLLTGNAIGNDAHGQFLVEQLSQIEGLTYEPHIEKDCATPYGILVQAGKYEAGVMLSPTAGPLVLPTQKRDAQVARYFFGDESAFSSDAIEGTQVRLPASSQDYQSLVGTLAAVSTVYLQLVGKDWPEEVKSAFTEIVTELYNKRFTGPESVPTLEEIEATLHSLSEVAQTEE